MASQDGVMLLDVGSEKLTLIQASKGVNGTFDIKRFHSVDYDGYLDGVWLEKDNLVDSVADLFEMSSLREKDLPKTIYIGIPGEFTTVVCKEVNIDFGRAHKVTDEDIEAIFEEGNTFRRDGRYTLVNISAVYYVTDDGRRMIQPIGLVTSRLKAMISYVLCSKEFIRPIEQIMYTIGINNVEYISSIWAEAEYLFEADSRDKSLILVDVGHISTSVAMVRGDGLLHMLSFSLGGGNISADLNMYLDIPYQDAEIIKRKADLSRQYLSQDVYSVSTKTGERSYSAEQVNDVIYTRISVIADTINQAIDKCEYECPQYMPLYLTGGGISYIRGAKEILSKAVGRPVEIVAPQVPSLNKPELSSTISAVDVAIRNSKTNQNAIIAFFKRIFGR